MSSEKQSKGVINDWLIAYVLDLYREGIIGVAWAGRGDEVGIVFVDVDRKTGSCCVLFKTLEEIKALPNLHSDRKSEMVQAIGETHGDDRFILVACVVQVELGSNYFEVITLKLKVK